MTQARRFLPFLALALPALFIAIYTGWWFWLADRWPEGIARWADSLAARGWKVETGAVSTSGWPGPLRIVLAQPSATDTHSNAWSGPPLTLIVSPFSPLEPRLKAPGSHIVTLASHLPETITFEALEGAVQVEHRKPSAASLTGKKVGGLGMTVDRLTVEAHRLPPGPEGQANPILAAQLDIDRLTLPENLRLPLDRTVSAAHAALRLRGEIPPGPAKEALAAWRDAGGTLELDSLDLNWPPITAAGNATIALDTALQPELAGGFTVRGAAEAVERAAKAKMLDPSAAVVAKLALGLAAKKGSDGTPEVKVGVSVQNRTLSLGPVQLGQLPEVNW